jgi:hypothetical protein
MRRLQLRRDLGGGALPVTQAAFDECLCAEVTDAFGLIGDVVGA